MKLKIYSVVLLFLVTMLSAGCATNEVIVPQYANLMNNDIVITAKDGSWSFSSKKPFNPPVVHEDGYLKVAYLNKNLSAYNHSRYKDNVIDVYVQVGGKEKLHGKILFAGVFEHAGSASAKRKWTVGISKQYIDIARGGNVAVVYQPYKFKKRDWASWALWMSSLPL